MRHREQNPGAGFGQSSDPEGKCGSLIKFSEWRDCGRFGFGNTPSFNIPAGENPGQWPRLPRHAPVARSVVMRLRPPSRGSKGGPAQHNLLITTLCSRDRRRSEHWPLPRRGRPLRPPSRRCVLTPRGTVSITRVLYSIWAEKVTHLERRRAGEASSVLRVPSHRVLTCEHHAFFLDRGE